MRISLIAAMAKNRTIGQGGGMPWHLPEDLAYFKKTTLGKPVLMGRKTYSSIGRPLPGRLNIVITRDDTLSIDGVQVTTGLQAAIEIAQKQDVEEIMVIGGGQIYAEALELADRVYLTEIQADIDGDTVFPDLPKSQWREVSRENAKNENLDLPKLRFVILDRIN
jgi:dihydrofolate reductase